MVASYFDDCIQQTIDKGFILVGTTANHPPRLGIILIKTSENGNFQWKKIYILGD